MSDNAKWCTVLGTLLAFVLLLVVSLVALDVYRDCCYIEAGYTRSTVPGHDWPIWVKGSQDNCSSAATAPGLDPRNWVISEPVPLSNQVKGAPE